MIKIRCRICGNNCVNGKAGLPLCCNCLAAKKHNDLILGTHMCERCKKNDINDVNASLVMLRHKDGNSYPDLVKPNKNYLKIARKKHNKQAIITEAVIESQTQKIKELENLKERFKEWVEIRESFFYDDPDWESFDWREEE